MTRPISLPAFPRIRKSGCRKNNASAVRRRRLWSRDFWLILTTIGLVMLAWGWGYFSRGADIAARVPEVLPSAKTIENHSGVYFGYAEDGSLVGYAASGEAPGYGGPIQLLVGVAPDGQIIAAQIIQQRDTPGFFRLVLSSGLLESLTHHQALDPLRLGEDLDAVSGATLSAEGVAAAARRALELISREGLNQERPPENRPIELGFPELVLLLLYAGGYFGHKMRSGVWKRRIRWTTLTAGMLVLGFLYTAPLTIAQVIAFVSGYWPDWHNNLYWYLLIGGILFVTTVDARNPYCGWFCPFGAVQEGLSVLSGAKIYRPRRLSGLLTWVQRGLALAAILLGLSLRRPGVASYEPFATLFDLRGSALQWVFLILVLIASLLVYRPFCNYLCPLAPVIDFIAAVRRVIEEVWRRWMRPAKKSLGNN